MYCPYCGASNRDEDEFCRKCGKSIQINKNTSKISKLKVGWMVWWRAMLPVEVAGGLLVWNMQSNFMITSLAMLPFLFFLLNWAGKVVARKKYGFSPMGVMPQHIAVGFGVVPVPRIGFGIFWRMMVISIPLRLFYFVFSGFALTSGSIFLLSTQVLFLPVYVFLMIVILGWATKRTIEPMFR